MTAALHLSYDASYKPAAPVDPGRWVSIDQAAKTLGLSERQLRRRCEQLLEAQGLAIKTPRASDSAICWHIARSYDRRLSAAAEGPLAELQQPPTPRLDQFTKRQRAQAFARLACLKQYREARSILSAPMDQWLPRLIEKLSAAHPGLKISARTLQRWHTLYAGPSDLTKLIDSRGGNQRGQGDPAAWDFFRSIYLDPRQPSIKNCWQRTKQEAKDKTGPGAASINAVAAWMKKFPRLPGRSSASRESTARVSRLLSRAIRKPTERDHAG